MSEVLQTQPSVKLYEYNYEKPELSDEILEHYGVKGMRWGHRKLRVKVGRLRRKTKKVFGKKKNTKVKYANKQEAMKAKDIQYLQEHKGEFSTNELNEVMNRINTEQRLDKMVYDQKKAKHAFASKAFKVLATSAISGLTFAAVNYAMSDKEGRDAYTKAKVARDIGIGAGVGLAGQILPGRSSEDLKRLKALGMPKKK